jgi:tRNA (cmo5U34)-methyltransferase
MSAPVNLWTESAWAQRYLRERDDIPHRMEGFAVLMELLPAAPRRVLDLGTGDGFTLGLVRNAHPDADGVGIDFSVEMLALAHERFAGDHGVEIVAARRLPRRHRQDARRGRPVQQARRRPHSAGVAA